jgi:2-polyprenyl-6-methoxyphenol hydroxylase-like FAD-dependent oxidoreductase
VVSQAHVSLTWDGKLIGAYGIMPGLNNKHRNLSSNIRRRVDVNIVKYPDELLDVVRRDTDDLANATVRTAAKKSKYHIKHNIHIPRQKLREIMMNKINQAHIHWNKQLISMNHGYANLPHGDKKPCVHLHFQDGTTFDASLLVGADGIHSTVRKLLFQKSTDFKQDHDKMNYLGLMVILGFSPVVFDCKFVPLTANNPALLFKYISNSRHYIEGNDLRNPLMLGVEVDSTDTLDQQKQNSFRQQVQWVDGQVRIFTMPFNKTHTMWQVSLI